MGTFVSSMATSLLPTVVSLLAILILCIFCSLSSAASSNKAFDVSAKCPHILTTATLTNEPRDNTTLRVLVPWKVGFEQFVKFLPDSCVIDGFSIQVFLQALNHMQHPPPPHYKFVLHGSGDETPSYDGMLDMLVNKTVDAVVADLTITRERMELVAFTAPYLASSLVMVTPFRFTSLCVFQAQQESVRTHLGRIITVTWLFVMLIFNSSYTASLASLLSAQKRYPTIDGFQTLLRDENISLGYQQGSFMETYMSKLNLQGHRLKNLTSERDYAQALQEGKLKPDSIGAVLDELPYIQILLRSECGLTKSSTEDDQLPSFGGFGFAFRKGDPLIDEVSKMILQMAEDSTLQTLQDGWKIGDDKKGRCSQDGEPSHLRLRSFGGLFSIVGSVYITCIIWRLTTKAIKSAEPGGCSPLNIQALIPCTQDGSSIGQTRELSLSRRSNRVHDENQDDQASLIVVESY